MIGSRDGGFMSLHTNLCMMRESEVQRLARGARRKRAGAIKKGSCGKEWQLAHEEVAQRPSHISGTTFLSVQPPALHSDGHSCDGVLDLQAKGNYSRLDFASSSPRT